MASPRRKVVSICLTILSPVYGYDVVDLSKVSTDIAAQCDSNTAFQAIIYLL